MRLKSITYREFAGTPQEWALEGLSLGPINLVVGKNATGKTRTLNIIIALGDLLAGRRNLQLGYGTWEASFEQGGRFQHYLIELSARKVIREEFRDGDRRLLVRRSDGTGEILFEKEGKAIEFQMPDSDLAAVARVDRIQHPYLEPLREWGEGCRHYLFGEAMGKAALAILVNEPPSPDPRNVNAVIALFQQGANNFPGEFRQAVLRDMNWIGYDIEDIKLTSPTDVQVVSNVPAELVVLCVKERDLPCPTQQPNMSQGMFRALSIIIHMNHAVIASKPSCIVVDDIGEGLDFERSCKLIELLRERALNSTVQLILSTNDKFVMNEIPLEEWSALQRQGNHVRVLNYENSKELFEEFKFTGLSNFSFFEMDFANSSRTAEVAAHE